MIDIYLNRWRRVPRNKVLPQIQVPPTNENQQLAVENIELTLQK